MYNKKLILNLINKRCYKEAIEKIDEALTKKADNIYYIYLKAYCYNHLGNYIKAVSMGKEALEAGFSAEKSYLLIGQSYEVMGWFEDAKLNYLLGLESNSNNYEIKSAYAAFLLKNNEEDKAYSFILEAIKKQPKNSIVFHNAIYFYLNNSNCKSEKQQQIEKYIEGNFKEITKYLKLGREQLKKKRYKAALGDFEKAYLLDPENSAIADILDDLRLKSKVIYKPLVIIDIVGGWIRWGEALAFIASLTFIILISQGNSSLAVIFSIILILWILIAVYKFVLDLFYWNSYELEQ